MANNTSLAQNNSSHFFVNSTNSITKKFPSPPVLFKETIAFQDLENSKKQLNCSLFDYIGQPKLVSKLSNDKKLAEKELFSLLNLLKKHRIYITYSYPFSINYTYKILKDNLHAIKVNDLKSDNYIQLLNLEQLIESSLLPPIEQTFSFLKIINTRNWKPIIEIMDELVQIGNFQFGCPQLLEYQNRYFEHWNNLQLKSTSVISTEINEKIAHVSIEILLKKHPKAKTQLLQFHFELNSKFDWWVIHKITPSKVINFKQ